MSVNILCIDKFGKKHPIFRLNCNWWKTLFVGNIFFVEDDVEGLLEMLGLDEMICGVEYPEEKAWGALCM